MTGYYDIVLGLIPVALVGGAATLTVAGLAITSAVSLAACVSVALIGHALFVNGPVDAESAPSSADRSGPSFNSAD